MAVNDTILVTENRENKKKTLCFWKGTWMDGLIYNKKNIHNQISDSDLKMFVGFENTRWLFIATYCIE